MDDRERTERVKRALSGSEAVECLAYYAAHYTGGFFDSFGRRLVDGAFVDSSPDRVELEDVLSLSLLSAPLDPKEMLNVLAHNERFGERQSFPDILGRLPSALSLRDAPDYAPEDELWQAADAAHALLSSVSGIGPTRNSKLLARKRPHLIPVWDSKVAAFLETPSGLYWASMQNLMRDDAVHDRLEDVRTRASGAAGDARDRVAAMALLRVLDIVVWMRVWGARDAGTIGEAWLLTDN